MKRPAFTIWELLIVMVVLGLVVAIAYPILSRPRRHGHSSCTSHIRQLATAVQMYVQDNNRRYPGEHWSDQIMNYAGTQKIFLCPEDKTDGSVISYGYSGLLVRPDGQGVHADQVLAPTEVGTLADTTPSCAWPGGGGLIGGGGTSAMPAVDLCPRHKGTIVGFCDGHAKYFPGTPNAKNIQDGPGRAFYQASGLKCLDFAGGMLGDLPLIPEAHRPLPVPPRRDGCPPIYVSASPLYLGGDSAGLPLLRAAAALWANAGGVPKPAKSRRQAECAGQYAWVDASGAGAGAPIAKDAVVFIVSKHCKIPMVNTQQHVLSTLDLMTLFRQGYVKNILQIYILPKSDGGRLYLNWTLDSWGATVGEEIGKKAVEVKDDWDMVNKVAADPYAIGCCSAAAVDPYLVDILILQVNGANYRYPNADPQSWLVPNSAAECPYPLIRTLTLHTAGAGKDVAALMATQAFLKGPLYQASYFRP